MNGGDWHVKLGEVKKRRRGPPAHSAVGPGHTGTQCGRGDNRGLQKLSASVLPAPPELWFHLHQEE